MKKAVNTTIVICLGSALILHYEFMSFEVKSMSFEVQSWFMVSLHTNALNFPTDASLNHSIRYCSEEVYKLKTSVTSLFTTWVNNKQIIHDKL